VHLPLLDLRKIFEEILDLFAESADDLFRDVISSGLRVVVNVVDYFVQPSHSTR
jgi:hypothetical protein